MKILVTSGSTQVNIDSVRVITNIFKGKTGNTIAHQLGKAHDVTLLTSNTNMVPPPQVNEIIKFRTYDELYNKMKEIVKDFDIIIHSAAVSDYKPIPFDGKISSDKDELIIKLTPTEKIIDKIRDWGFNGKLVKFKLQVNTSDEKLVEIAEKSRIHSNADIIVANCLEWANERAYVISDTVIENVKRSKIYESIVRNLR